MQKNHKDVEHRQSIKKKKRKTAMFNSTQPIVICTVDKIRELIEEIHGVILSKGTVWR